MSLNWPTVALVLGVLVLIIFRKPIGAAILRTKKVEIGKSAWEGQDIPQTTAPAVDGGAMERFQQDFLNPLLIRQEEVVRKDLYERKLNAPADREKALIRGVAAWQIALHFERAASLIWASQLGLLVHLNEREAGTDTDTLKALFYDPAVEKYPQAYEHYSFEKYLGFLESSSMVERNGTTVTITLEGREFLKFLIDTRRTLPTMG